MFLPLPYNPFYDSNRHSLPPILFLSVSSYSAFFFFHDFYELPLKASHLTKYKSGAASETRAAWKFLRYAHVKGFIPEVVVRCLCPLTTGRTAQILIERTRSSFSSWRVESPILPAKNIVQWIRMARSKMHSVAECTVNMGTSHCKHAVEDDEIDATSSFRSICVCNRKPRSDNWKIRLRCIWEFEIRLRFPGVCLRQRTSRHWNFSSPLDDPDII